MPCSGPSPTAAPTVLRRGTFDDTEAHGINNAGQIVGWGFTSRTLTTVALFWASPTAAPERGLQRY